MRKEPMKARQKAGQAGASLCRLVHSGARATFSLEQLFAAMVAQTVPSRVRRTFSTKKLGGALGRCAPVDVASAFGDQPAGHGGERGRPRGRRERLLGMEGGEDETARQEVARHDLGREGGAPLWGGILRVNGAWPCLDVEVVCVGASPRWRQRGRCLWQGVGGK